VNPHTSKVVTKQVVERVSGEEAQTVRDPVGLVSCIIIICLGSSSELADGLGSLLIGAGPDAKSDAVKGVGRILLQNEGMVDTMWLTAASADLDIMGKTGLIFSNVLALSCSAKVKGKMSQGFNLPA
jgi:hypothetical protein